MSHQKITFSHLVDISMFDVNNGVILLQHFRCVKNGIAL